ncbi:MULTISPECIES: cupin domain-containing protein [Novosphingobium]|uniref:Cupin domain-containing protein n=1 Tax=Novosphingobium mangrovi (ex Hu et al. 2023) TaxID=2930094 RepID=A0ABT0A803_9SPHN|nr:MULTISPECIES: cupin domain-containing protein [Novosphingobium]MCJ1959302.1 cupin domain-containing protein [Novosphingobium mangrovi (ex Hu et al. 2023)]
MSDTNDLTKQDAVVLRNGTAEAIKGPEQTFTGTVRIDRIFNPPEPARAGFAIVNFEPGARTNWHTHPAGQTLYVTQGVGWHKCEGGEKTEIRAGDTVWCNCGKRHWHGATDTTYMQHIAITEAIDGSPVNWMEAVSDEEYLSGPVKKD